MLKCINISKIYFKALCYEYYIINYNHIYNILDSKYLNKLLHNKKNCISRELII